MLGALEYTRLFKTGQYEKFYFVSGEHARGKTFRIYLLPKGEVAIPNGPMNAPLNENAVEIYGIVSGQPGWSEVYGWIHEGKWQLDFERMVAEKKKEIEAEKDKEKSILKKKKKAEEKRIQELLSDY